MIPSPVELLLLAKFKKDFEMSYVVELKKSYVDLFRALDSYGYLSVDMGVVLSGLRAGLSADMVSRVFKSAKTPKTPKEPKAKTPKEPKAKTPKTPKEPKAKTPKTPKEKKATSRVPSAYMCFMADKRSEIRDLLKEATPEMSAKELNVSVMRKVGEIWKAMSVEDKSVYVSQSASLKLAKASSEGESPVVEDEAKVEEVEEEVEVEETQVEAEEEAKVEDEEDASPAEVEVVEAKVEETQVEETQAKVEAEEVEESDEADDDVLIYNASFNVWVHEVSGMYYAINDIESVPLGQLKSGKLVPFKKPSCKRIGAN